MSNNINLNSKDPLFNAWEDYYKKMGGFNYVHNSLNNHTQRIHLLENNRSEKLVNEAITRFFQQDIIRNKTVSDMEKNFTERMKKLEKNSDELFGRTEQLMDMVKINEGLVKEFLSTLTVLTNKCEGLKGDIESLRQEKREEIVEIVQKQIQKEQKGKLGIQKQIQKRIQEYLEENYEQTMQSYVNGLFSKQNANSASFQSEVRKKLMEFEKVILEMKIEVNARMERRRKIAKRNGGMGVNDGKGGFKYSNLIQKFN